MEIASEVLEVSGIRDYAEMMDGILRGGITIEEYLELNSGLYDLHEFPDHVSAVNRGLPAESCRGDRLVCSRDRSYNLLFRKSDGFTAKWGRTVDEDPTHCPFGNEIADIEITTSCAGVRWSDGVRRPCPFCYKANGPAGRHMSLETFKGVFAELDRAKCMTQIAFGVDAQCKSNPDTWAIMDWAASHGVTPNVTVADIDAETAERIVSRCGACAVSAYEFNPDACFDSVKLLTDEARRQGRRDFRVNVHLLISEETADFADRVVDARLRDPRLRDMFAIVLLCLKQKGRGGAYHRMPDARRKALVERLLSLGLPFGMDSCGAPAFLDIIRGRDDYARLERMVEPCESGSFSIYVSCDGVAFPCSFMEGEGDWRIGIDLKSPGALPLWRNPRIEAWRGRAIRCIACKGRNECPYYDV